MKKMAFFIAVLLITSLLAGCSIIVPNGVYGYVYIRSYWMQSEEEGVDIASDEEIDVLITGQETAPPGYRPLVGARVEIRHNITLIGRESSTDFSGRFEIRDLQSGASTLKVTHWELRNPITRWLQVPSSGVRRFDVEAAEDPYSPSLYWVIIGVQNYEDGNKSSAGSDADASRMYDVLYNQNRLPAEYSLLRNSSATKSAIASAIKYFVDAARSVEDHLVIYFSGFSGADYLSPYDDRGPGLSKQSITDAELEFWLRGFPGYVTVIVDGSYSETMADGRPLQPLALKKPKYTVLTGAQWNRQAQYFEDFGGGVFTYFLWQGLLYGSADGDYDGFITPAELYSYTYTEMVRFYQDKDPSVRHYPTIHRGNSQHVPIFRYR